MKKLISMMLTCLALSAGVSAQTITVSDVEALASGETVNAKLHIAGVSGMTSMHFEVQLSSTFTVGTVSATSAWTALFSQEGGVVSAMSTSTNAFSGEGDVAIVPIVIPANTATGSYPVTVNNIRVNGETLEGEVSFDVKVVTAHTVVLDETSATAPEAATGVNVRVKRSIVKNIWSTICLPFDMTEEQLKTAFGDDVELASFKGWESTEWDDDDNATAIEVSFKDETSIEANTPYIIKVSKNLTEFTVDGVDIDPEDEPSVTVGRMNRGTFGSFTGSYVPIAIDEECLFLSKNKFWYSIGNTQMKGFRGYFYFQELLADYSGGSSARISFTFDDSETTGIGATLNDNGEMINDNAVYDLQGRRVSESVIQNSKLQNGLYIVNGKKVIK